MKFLMFVCTDPAAEKYDPALDNFEEWVSAMDKSGKRVRVNDSPVSKKLLPSANARARSW